MGLDMYLTGEKFYWTDFDNPKNNLKEDGFRLSTKKLELGYWRKHPDLHGYIVNEFAEGIDECQKIELAKEDLMQIMISARANDFPRTEGFFFGASDEAGEQDTIEQIQKALKWLDTEEKGVAKSVYYRASW